MKQLLRLLPLLVIGLALAGCGGIPKELHQAAEGVPAKIKATRLQIEEKQKSYSTFVASAGYSEFKLYAEREKWEGEFGNAKAKLGEAESVLERNIRPLLEKNESEKEGAVQTQLSRVNKMLREAEALANKPFARKDFLVQTRAEAPGLVAKAKTQTEAMAGLTASLREVADQAKIDYPAKEKDLASRLAYFDRLNREGQQWYLAASHQLESDAPDYAIIGDNCTLLQKRLDECVAKDKEIRGKIGELGRTYSKVLVDMRADYSVTVGRSDWNEWSDFDSENTYNYRPIVVDEKTFEWCDSLDDEGEIGEDMVTRLGLDPNEGNPDSSKTFWIENASVTYYHMYKVVENGQDSETGWVVVDEKYFDDNMDNLGMELVSKPIGLYEEEVITVAAPPGMAMVGNQKYGQWKTDNSGNKFWEWYGQYMFYSHIFGLNRPYYYGYGEWDTWNRGYRGRSPYYGPKDEDRYGTASSTTQSRYGGSTWARRGGFRMEDYNLRESGAGYRAGGPGGGGK